MYTDIPDHYYSLQGYIFNFYWDGTKSDMYKYLTPYVNVQSCRN